MTCIFPTKISPIEEGVGHAMSSGWVVCHFVLLQRRKAIIFHNWVTQAAQLFNPVPSQIVFNTDDCANVAIFYQYRPYPTGIAIGCGKNGKEHKVLFEKIIWKTLIPRGQLQCFQPSIHLLLIPFLMFLYFSFAFYFIFDIIFHVRQRWTGKLVWNGGLGIEF